MVATWALTVCLVCFSLCDSALCATTQDTCDATGDCHVVEASEGSFSRLLNGVSGAVQGAVNVATNTIYSTFLEPTFNQLFELFSPDQPLGKFVRAVGTNTLTVILALLCILFSYLFLRYFSLLFVLAFNCTMFLLHHFYGPEWIFKKLEWGCKWIYWVLNLMVSYPYVSASLIVLLFLSSILVPLYRWKERSSRVRQMNRIDQNVVLVKEAIATMEGRLRQIESLLRIHLEEHSEGGSLQVCWLKLKFEPLVHAYMHGLNFELYPNLNVKPKA